MGKTGEGTGMGGKREDIWKRTNPESTPLAPCPKRANLYLLFSIAFCRVLNIDQINGFEYLTLVYEPSCSVTCGKACVMLSLRLPGWPPTQQHVSTYLQIPFPHHPKLFPCGCLSEKSVLLKVETPTAKEKITWWNFWFYTKSDFWIFIYIKDI